MQNRARAVARFGNIAGYRRRQCAITLSKEKREALLRSKRLCRAGFGVMHDDADNGMLIDEEQSVLDDQTSSAVDELRCAMSFQERGALQRKRSALSELRRLLSRSEFPPVEAAVEAGAIPLLVQCLSFGSADEQLLEAAWCLTNIAAGNPEETKALLPALPLLVAHLGEKSSLPVAEQCAWALGNVAGEGEELRNILLAQGALLPLARMVVNAKGSTARTAAWALSNLIKGPDPAAATELARVDGMLDAILRHLRKVDEDLTTEIAWVVVYLSSLSDLAVNMLLQNDILQLLVQRLSTSDSPQLLIPVLRSLGNLIASGSEVTISFLLPGSKHTHDIIKVITKCLKMDHRVLKKEAAWVLSNIAACSIPLKQLIHCSEATPCLLALFSTATFDIRKEAAYVLGNLCVAPAEQPEKPKLITEHLVSLVEGGCLPGFVSLVKSVDIEAAKLGLQFLELVLRGMPRGEGPRLVEQVDGIEAMERYQFHENEELRCMANVLVDRYFGETYGLDNLTE